MIAAFLKSTEGGFDYPAALFSAFVIFPLSWSFCELYRAFKTGRILVSVGSKCTGSGQLYVARETNPIAFWVVVALYCLVFIPLMSILTVGICFGLFRKPN